MPEYACVDTGADFAKTTEVALPEVDAAMVADAMAKQTYDAVCAVHNETSTGVTNPIRAIGEVVTTSISPERSVTWCYVTDPEGNALELQAVRSH